ncbi:Uncharacterised protein [Mycobacteroides abscessus subsp. abscessus]|nr:Uncharacterised protein [Mycobacteroides abscessus subsp. abscessus]
MSAIALTASRSIGPLSVPCTALSADLGSGRSPEGPSTTGSPAIW